MLHLFFKGKRHKLPKRKGQFFVIKEKLSNGSLQSQLAQLYCTDTEGVTHYVNRFLRLIDTFEQTFGSGEVRLFSAPGRTEIGGNHTDHQKGHVLAASVNLDIIAAVRENNSKKIQIQSDGYPMISVDLNNLQPIPSEKNTTHALVRGVAAHIIHLGYPISGFDAALSSDVLKGSGLSSSAAFEVMIGTIINGLFCNKELSPIKIAQIGQYAENEFFGKPCGLMDQMASSVGGFVAIDFYDTEHPVVEKVDFDFAACGHALCIIDTGGNHADLTPDYASIPQEMKTVAAFFEKDVLSQVKEADVLSNIASLRQCCTDRAILRALHFFADDKKAIQEAKALKEKDFDTFRKLITASGLSSSEHLQNVYSCSNPQEQGLSLALALCQQILGDKGAYRVHGGGFAGTIQAFVPLELLSVFREKMDAVFGKGKCYVLSIRPVGGVELM